MNAVLSTTKINAIFSTMKIIVRGIAHFPKKKGYMIMTKYRKKPIIIEALQLRWDTWGEICHFVGVGKMSDEKPHGEMRKECAIGLDIPTPEGVLHADENDWIIKGIKGEFYPCKPDIFEATYEKLQDVSSPEGDLDCVFTDDGGE